MFIEDTRFAIRLLRRTPGFVVTTVLTLGIGLGLNTMLFTLFNAYVLRSAAVKNPRTLYQLAYTTKKGTRYGRFSWAQFQSISNDGQIFSDAVAVDQFYARLDGSNVEGQSVSGNYFQALGVPMFLGRPILPDDARAPGANAVAVLSNAVWKAQYAADPNILGRKIMIDGYPFQVIGVCAPEFTGIGVAETPEGFYVPATMAKQVPGGTDPFGPEQPARFSIVGRVVSGATVDAARAAMTAAVVHATENLPESSRASEAMLTSRATIIPLEPRILAALSPLIVAFGLVLVICCANVANMMLARGIARQKEIGVRLALGARRSRLIGQLLLEGFILAAISAGVAFAVAYVGVHGAQRLLMATLPATFAAVISFVPLELDKNVLAFLILAASLATVLSGLVPALQATRVSLTDAMRGQFSEKMRPSRLRYALVVSQITVCVLLLIMTGVLTRSSASFQNTNTGLETRGVVSPIFLGRSGDSVNQRLTQYLSTQSWVDSMAAASRPPLSGTTRNVSITIPGKTQSEAAGFNLVSNGYFPMLGIQIIRGRNFSQVEENAEAPVAIVSQATAQRFWPTEDALGKTISIGDVMRGGLEDRPAVNHAVVIGIAKDVVSGLLADGIDRTMIYLPTSANAKRGTILMIRAKLDSASARNSLESALKTVWPDRPAFPLSVEDGFAVQVYPFLAASWIGLALGLIALALTVSGMYGVMSYLVGQRTKEIGIRMALGASPGRVIGMILRQSGRLAVFGLTLGLIFSLALGRMLTHIFYMIPSFDAIAYGAGIAVVSAAAIIAAYIPSRRAALIDPVETLRAE